MKNRLTFGVSDSGASIVMRNLSSIRHHNTVVRFRTIATAIVDKSITWATDTFVHWLTIRYPLRAAPHRSVAAPDRRAFGVKDGHLLPHDPVPNSVPAAVCGAGQCAVAGQPRFPFMR
jgi:hypothetical protein